MFYGKPRTLSKFKVLELVARVPYQAWEQAAYIAITHVHDQTGLARRIHERIAQSRAEQDNEQWHLLILDELIADYGNYESLADVFRQIGHDKRVHKQESETQLTQPRFH